jgi:NAD(P)-dependent dehydrogenase (short-subunit alcohol dehydrogenase family)
LELEPSDMETMWRVGALGGFLLAREAARHMLPRGRGTVIFTGATASLRGGAGFAAFAGGKFALRALAQSLARELGPSGIHVAHVVLDGQVGRDPAGAKIDPDAVAETYLALHLQPKSAWTHELDLRPSVEKF